MIAFLLVPGAPPWYTITRIFLEHFQKQHIYWEVYALNIRLRRIQKKNLSVNLFADFSRHQEVTRAFRAESGKWVIRDIHFTEEWGENEKKELVRCLANTLETKGIVYGAFEGDKLVGFLSVESRKFGSQKQYVELTSLHVDHNYRRRGIGRKLFECAVSCGQSLGGKKLYISSHSSVESQAFYRAMGCVEAVEFSPEALEKEPCDCQLEYPLDRVGGFMGMYMCLGAGIGMCFGTAMDNLALGMCIGMAIGVALGSAMDADQAKKRKALQPDPDSPAGRPVEEGGLTQHEDN